MKCRVHSRERRPAVKLHEVRMRAGVWRNLENILPKPRSLGEEPVLCGSRYRKWAE